MQALFRFAVPMASAHLQHQSLGYLHVCSLSYTPRIPDAERVQVLPTHAVQIERTAAAFFGTTSPRALDRSEPGILKTGSSQHLAGHYDHVCRFGGVQCGLIGCGSRLVLHTRGVWCSFARLQRHTCVAMTGVVQVSVVVGTDRSWFYSALSRT